MAQKVTVALEDDLTGGPADQTVRFAVEGMATRRLHRSGHRTGSRESWRAPTGSGVLDPRPESKISSEESIETSHTEAIAATQLTPFLSNCGLIRRNDLFA